MGSFSADTNRRRARTRRETRAPRRRATKAGHARRGLGTRRGLGFQIDQNLAANAQDLQQQASSFINSAGNGSGVPPDERQGARDTIDTINNLLNSFASTRSELQSIARDGNYVQSTREQAQSLIQQVDEIVSQLDAEKQRAEAFLDNNPPIGDPVQVQQPPTELQTR